MNTYPSSFSSLPLGEVVTLMTRGQITLPKSYRDDLELSPGEPLNVVKINDYIVIKPLAAATNKPPRSIPPRVSKAEYLKILKSIKGVWWTKADDIARKKMEAKESWW